MTVVTIIYPTDPLGVVPGGTDTCIRDILKCAPEDVRMRLIGVSTDPDARPAGKWTTCDISGNKYEFYPVITVSDLRKQMRVPLSLKFTLKLIGNKEWEGSDILQFHRLEPALLFYRKKISKITVIHQNMKVINDKNSDIRWKYLPGVYFKLEDLVLPRFDEIRIVRENAVRDYKQRFPSKKEHIAFLPTWMNPDLFYVADENERYSVRRELTRSRGWQDDAMLMVSVGRLDYQKDPLLAVEVLREIVNEYPNIKHVWIGDGVLRTEVEEKIASLGLEDSVALVGVMSQDDVARIVRSSDLMLLSSAYEGMPRCVVEALGCGVPVASTDVGEINLLIKSGKNGNIAAEHSKDAIVQAVKTCIENINVYSGVACTRAVEKYSARVVLEDLFTCYRQLSATQSREPN